MEATTKQFRKRNAILSLLRRSREHPSAETVFTQLKDEMPDISLATVYRNLALFKQQGLIMSLGNVQGVERFDGNTAPHVHFVCNHCGQVMDLEEMEVPQALCHTASDLSGARVEECRLIFSGACAGCRD